MMSFKTFIVESDLADRISARKAHEEKLSKLSPEKHIEKLDKTSKSIETHKSYGGNTNHARAHELIDRYNSHYDALKTHHPEAHKKWLKDRGYVSHTGWDLYA